MCHRSRAILKQNLDFAFVDDFCDDAVAEFGMPDELAFGQCERNSKRLKGRCGLACDGLLPGRQLLALRFFRGSHTLGIGAGGGRLGRAAAC